MEEKEFINWLEGFLEGLGRAKNTGNNETENFILEKIKEVKNKDKKENSLPITNPFPYTPYVPGTNPYTNPCSPPFYTTSITYTNEIPKTNKEILKG